MRLIDLFISDVRYAVRSVRRTPGFTIVTFATLTLGIAAVGSIFSYMNAVYFGPLPYHDANRIVGIAEMRDGSRSAFNSVSVEAMRLFRASTRSFDRVSTYRTQHPVAAFDGDPKQIIALEVDTAFMPMFNLRPETGRLIAADEILRDAAVVMISDALWQTRFGGDEAAIGRQTTLGVKSYRIVGVLPPEFRFPWQTDAIVPMRDGVEPGESRTSASVDVIARLRPGISRRNARAEMSVLSAKLSTIDANVYRSARLVVRDEMLDRNARQFLPVPMLFIGAGAFVLMIACANVANLLLARAAHRRVEMAIRSSLGASRSRLFAQMLTESLLISTAAGIAGTLLGGTLIRLWLRLVPDAGFASWFRIGLDGRILSFAIATVAVVTVIAGMSPARESARFDLARALKTGGDPGTANRSLVKKSKRRLAIQLALSVALFISAALFVRSFRRLNAVDVGYPAAKIASVAPLFDPSRFSDLGARVQFAEEIARRAKEIPGAGVVAIRGDFAQLRSESASDGGLTPFAKGRDMLLAAQIIPDGDLARALRANARNRVYAVSESYFSLLGLRIRSGRGFSASDDLRSQAVTVISAAAAKQLWGAANPLGRTVQQGQAGARLLVIGVVDDVRDLIGGRGGYSADPRVTLYVSARQALTGNPAILAMSRGEVLPFRSKIVDLVRVVDPAMVVLRQPTLASQFDEAFAVTRVFGTLVGGFAVSALALSIIGIYGVISFGIVQRTREIGIRCALGGTAADILRMIIAEGLRFAGVGLIVGIALAAALGQFARFMLFDVAILDPLTYITVSVGFGLVALLACYLPARRATRVDPMVALRAD